MNENVSSCTFVGILAQTALHRLHSLFVGLKYWSFERKNRFDTYYTYTQLYNHPFTFVCLSCSQCLCSAMVARIALVTMFTVGMIFAVCFVQAAFFVHIPKDPTLIHLLKRFSLKFGSCSHGALFWLMEAQEIHLKGLTMFYLGSDQSHPYCQ